MVAPEEVMSVSYIRTGENISSKNKEWDTLITLHAHSTNHSFPFFFFFLKNDGTLHSL